LASERREVDNLKCNAYPCVKVYIFAKINANKFYFLEAGKMSSKTIIEIILSVIGSFATAGAIVMASASWLGKVWATRILEKEKNRFANEMFKLQSKADIELEALKKRFETNIISFNLGFQKEFEIYNNLWKAVVELRNQTVAVSLLSDSMENENDKISKTLKNEAVDKYFEAIKKVLLIYEMNKPFYPMNIYERASEMAKLCNDVMSSLVNHGSKGISKDYVDAIIQNARLFYRSFDELCEAIRKRIESASLITF
jgi:hypothetical protein